MKIIKEVSKEDLREFLYRKMDINDSAIYEEMNSGNSIGIFQMNGGTAERLVNDVKPNSFAELNACNAMARPGPIENAPLYVEGKRGVPSNYPAAMEEILSSTYNVPIYQEQIMEIFHKIGGFSLEEADGVRGLMKKLGKADKDPEDVKKWDRTVKKFTKGAVANGITEAEAAKIANDLVSFAGYSFNLSHSSSYTYIAVMTLYLSVYFRKYFYSAVLDYEVDRDKSLFEVFQAIKEHGIKVLPPDVNKSDIKIKPLEGDEIIFGLQNVKFVGDKPAHHIIANRPYTSIFDFIMKTVYGEKGGVTSRVIDALIKAGGFDSLAGNNRKLYQQVFGLFWNNKKSTKIEEKLSALWKKIEEHSKSLPYYKEVKNSDLRELEKEIYGHALFTTLFTDKKVEMFNVMAKRGLVALAFDKVTAASIKVPVELESVRVIKDKNNNEMAFITVTDLRGKKESCPVFASYWEHVKGYFIPEKLYLMNFYRDEKGSILFGQKSYLRNQFKMMRMIKEVP